MKTRNSSFCRRASAGAMIFAFALRAVANPTGMTVVSGSATAQASGSQLSITTSQNVSLNWQSFNIAAGERTVFNQPNAYSIAINRINDQNASQIYGSLQANGIVVLMNSSGFYFGPNSFVSAAGLVVSTANCVPPQNFGGTWEFNGPPPLSSIVNYGSIKVGNGGSAYLIADKIENHGDVEAPGGSIGFAAGQTVTLSERPDGRGMSMQVTLPQGSVDNCGNVVADGGVIALNAKVVNQNGLIQANSVQNQNGVIELVASDSLNLASDSQISAHGDDASLSGSAGGSVTLKSGNVFSDETGSAVSVAGGANGGNGGQVEVSAPNMGSIHTRMDASAKSGFTGGSLLLDPDYIILDSFGGDSAGSGTVAAGDSPGGTLDLNVNSAFYGFNQITLQAKYDITLADATSWSLSDSTGLTSGQLNLEAGRNIIFGNTTALYDLNGWSIALYAGVSDFNHLTVQPGAGSIYLNAYDPNNPGNFAYDPSGRIQTSSGSITLVAGQDITVGTGFVNTTGGGSLTAHALAGNIDAGGYAEGYIFRPASSAGQGYYVDSSLGVGGLSTTGGGDVSLVAGGNVTSLLPVNNGYIYDGNFVSPQNGDYVTAGLGAYGAQAGNVTVVAGGDVTGHYLVANGTGNIFAGVQMDANGNPVKNLAGNYVLGSSGSAGDDSLNPNLALSLISGGWNVTAAQNIILQEVRNPNGVFNINRGGAWHAFNYSPSDYVNLTAGNLVQLGASAAALPRLDASDSVQVPVVYAPTLNVTAGAGGVTLTGDSVYNELILFPSPQGSLTINTTDGGSLVGNLPPDANTPQIFNLIVSDGNTARQNQFQTFDSLFGVNGHASTPVHEGHPTPIQLNISGDMDLVFLCAPEAAQITVGGDMNNCRFQGMNLAAGDVTSIDVTGDIFNRGAFTSIDLNGVSGAMTPDLGYLSQALSGSPSAATLATSFFYNPATKILTYQNIPGVSLSSVLQLLQHLTIQQTDANGIPLWANPPYNTVPLTRTVAVINAADAQALLNEYNALGGIPSGGYGFVLGGGGQFNVTAQNIDLGTTAGIQSRGVGLYQIGTSYPLASLFGNGNAFQGGADINVRALGNLDMYSSSIGSLAGGNVSVIAGGQVNAGSSDFTVRASGIRGIYSSGQGNVSVIAGGDVNVNGSRIATYDGGSVTVESQNGNVNAGTGASSPVTVQAYYEDPVTHVVYQNAPQIPFSGIVAMTFPPRSPAYPAPAATLGNILVETPNGNVNANVSGILQIALNNLSYPFAIVTVLAGYELRDGLGNPVSAAEMAGASPVEVSGGRDIDANGSGIIASNARLDASGDINGLIFARNNIDIVAQQNISVTALGLGSVNVSSTGGGSISGTIIGVGGVSASGGSVDASLISANVSGATSGSSGLGSGGAANATAAAASATDTAAATKQSDSGSDDELDKKKGKGIALAQKVSRVTVILPPKKLSEKTPSNNPL